jgi:hypothetical protein
MAAENTAGLLGILFLKSFVDNLAKGRWDMGNKEIRAQLVRQES